MSNYKIVSRGPLGDSVCSSRRYQWRNVEVEWAQPAEVRQHDAGHRSIVSVRGGALLSIEWSPADHLHISRELHEDNYCLRNKLPAYNSIIADRNSCCIGWNELFYEVATICVAMTMEEQNLPVDQQTRVWRHGWGQRLLPFQQARLPYVRFTQSGSTGERAIGRYVLSYP
jgi:hypothetical protein